MSANSMDAKASVGLANSLSNVFKLVSRRDGAQTLSFGRDVCCPPVLLLYDVIVVLAVGNYFVVQFFPETASTRCVFGLATGSLLATHPLTAKDGSREIL